MVGIYISYEEYYKKLDPTQKTRFCHLIRILIDGIGDEVKFLATGKTFVSLDQYCKVTFVIFIL